MAGVRAAEISFAAPVPAVVIAEMIGLPADMAMQLVEWSNRMVAMYMYGVTRETELDANAGRRSSSWTMSAR